jgi:hypothetical protein
MPAIVSRRSHWSIQLLPLEHSHVQRIIFVGGVLGFWRFLVRLGQCIAFDIGIGIGFFGQQRLRLAIRFSQRQQRQQLKLGIHVHQRQCLGLSIRFCQRQQVRLEERQFLVGLQWIVLLRPYGEWFGASTQETVLRMQLRLRL